MAGTSVEDWQSLFDLVRTADLQVWPVPRVLVIFRPRSAEEIDFDVDLRELQGQ